MTIDDKTIKTKSTRNLPKNKELIFYAKKNRSAGILAEVLFWQQVHYGIMFISPSPSATGGKGKHANLEHDAAGCHLFLREDEELERASLL